MCKNCKVSALGIQRQAELDAAIEHCKQVGINPATGGFLARHAWREYTPQFSQEERAALDRYNVATKAMKTLHQDYVFAGMRKEAEDAKASGRKPFSIVHGDKR